MILTYYCIITMIIIAYLLGSIPSAVWIAKNITASTSGNTAAKRRYDQHAAGTGTPGSPAGLSAGFPQGIRRGHIDRDPQIRRLHQRYVADKYQDHRRIRRRARTHLPHFRGIPGRQGRGDPGRGDYGYLSAGSTALLRRMGRDPDDDALRFTRLDRGRLLLSGLHDRFAQSEPIGAFHRLLVRHGRSAALHPPQNIVRLKNGTESKIYIWKPHRKADK